MPSTPSRPIIPTSACIPSSRFATREIMPDVTKYTASIGPSARYSTCRIGSGIGVNCLRKGPEISGGKASIKPLTA